MKVARVILIVAVYLLVAAGLSLWILSSLEPATSNRPIRTRPPTASPR